MLGGLMGLFSLRSLLGFLLFGVPGQGLLSEVPELYGLDHGLLRFLSSVVLVIVF